jgi:hypothetical protein
MIESLVQNETFSGEDRALEEVPRVRYEDCALVRKVSSTVSGLPRVPRPGP